MPRQRSRGTLAIRARHSVSAAGTCRAGCGWTRSATALQPDDGLGAGCGCGRAGAGRQRHSSAAVSASRRRHIADFPACGVAAGTARGGQQPGTDSRWQSDRLRGDIRGSQPALGTAVELGHRPAASGHRGRPNTVLVPRWEIARILCDRQTAADRSRRRTAAPDLCGIGRYRTELGTRRHHSVRADPRCRPTAKRRRVSRLRARRRRDTGHRGRPVQGGERALLAEFPARWRALLLRGDGRRRRTRPSPCRLRRIDRGRDSHQGRERRIADDLLADRPCSVWTGRRAAGTAVRPPHLSAHWRSCVDRRATLVLRPTGLAQYAISDTGVLAYHGGPSLSELVWLDRTGRRIGTMGNSGSYNDVRISPNGREVAVVVVDSRSGSSDISIFDRESGIPTRFTSDPGGASRPVWSTGGDVLFYRMAGANGPPDIYQKRADGRGPFEVRLALDGIQQPMDASSDGRYLVYNDANRATIRDIWLLPLLPPGAPRPYLATTAVEQDARISPDSRWVAFVSSESGKAEVYVAPIDDSSARRRVSTDGGLAPRWGPGGREMVYVDLNDTLMAMTFASGSTMKTGRPRPLFSAGRLFRNPGGGSGSRTTILLPMDSRSSSIDSCTIRLWSRLTWCSTGPHSSINVTFEPRNASIGGAELSRLLPLISPALEHPSGCSAQRSSLHGTRTGQSARQSAPSAWRPSRAVCSRWAH